MFRPRHFSAFIALGIVLAVASHAQTFAAGVARVDITPPNGLPLQGYPGSGRNATGVRDPLYARVLVLHVGAQRLALVDLDLIAPLEPAYVARLREAVRQDVSYVMVAAIHTHSGPALIPTLSPAPREWEAVAVGKITQAIKEAAAHEIAARLGTGYGVAYLGHNRLRPNGDGTVTWFEKNWTDVSTAPVDPTVAVLRVDDMNGSPIAILVNYACHPVIFGPDSPLYSADFPGVMTGVVEKAMGGKPLCFFLQGGDGDINPLYAVTPLTEGAVELSERAGTELGLVAAEVAEQIHTVADSAPSLQFAEDNLSFGLRWNAKEWLAADPKSAATIAEKTKAEYELPVTTVLINKQIALLGMPGEPFVDFQQQWRARCPVRDCFFLGYTNAYHGYFPTIIAATRGGYGAAHPSTWIEVGAGERMVDHALVRVYEMLGRIKPTPEDLQ
jgi:neutral/alkaline ceramidase-like enzyme